MSLIWYDGFQDGTLHRKPEWDALVGWTNQPGRDGTSNGAVSINASSSLKTLTLPASCATCYAGWAEQWLQTAPWGNANSRTMSWLRAGTVELVLWVNASGFFELRRTTTAGTLLATSSGHPALVLNYWYHLQTKAVLSSTAGSFELRLNGTTVINFSGVTAGTTGNVDQLVISTGVGTGSATYDDMYVNDAVDATATQGRAYNSFLGDLKVSTLIPSADGDLSQWTPSTGTAHAALVDEVAPNSTDYVFTAVTGNRDLYQLGDLTAAATNVYGVRVNHYSLKSDAGASSVKPIVKESGGLITVQATQALSTTAAGYSAPFLFTKPSASTTPFTVAEVNALQAGMELA